MEDSIWNLQAKKIIAATCSWCDGSNALYRYDSEIVCSRCLQRTKASKQLVDTSVRSCSAASKIELGDSVKVYGESGIGLVTAMHFSPDIDTYEIKWASGLSSKVAVQEVYKVHSKVTIHLEEGDWGRDGDVSMPNGPHGDEQLLPAVMELIDIVEEASRENIRQIDLYRDLFVETPDELTPRDLREAEYFLTGSLEHCHVQLDIDIPPVGTKDVVGVGWFNGSVGTKCDEDVIAQVASRRRCSREEIEEKWTPKPKKACSCEIIQLQLVGCNCRRG